MTAVSTWRRVAAARAPRVTPMVLTCALPVRRSAPRRSLFWPPLADTKRHAAGAYARSMSMCSGRWGLTARRAWCGFRGATRRTRCVRCAGSKLSNLTHSGAQFQRMLSAAVRADNALFCAIGATVRAARMPVNLVCSYLFAGFQLV